MQCQIHRGGLAKFKLSEKLDGTLFIKNYSVKQQHLQELTTLKQIELIASTMRSA
jgi:hypothetical protein